MLDNLVFGFGIIEGGRSKPGSLGSAEAIPKETRSELEETAGDVGSENETDLVTPMVNE